MTTLAQARRDLEEKRAAMQAAYLASMDADLAAKSAATPYERAGLWAEALRCHEAWEQARVAVREARIVVDRIAGAVARAS